MAWWGREGKSWKILNISWCFYSMNIWCGFAVGKRKVERIFWIYLFLSYLSLYSSISMKMFANRQRKLILKIFHSSSTHSHPLLHAAAHLYKMEIWSVEKHIEFLVNISHISLSIALRSWAFSFQFSTFVLLAHRHHLPPPQPNLDATTAHT